MTTTTRRTAITRGLMALGASTLPAGFARAQDYPNKTIRIVVPFGAGGPSDLISRMLALKLADAMKQTVIVENKPGASGIVGADLVAKAAPDGHTLLVINQLLVQVSALYASVPFDPLRDFIPITDIFSSPLWLAVNTSKTSARTMREFVAQVKSQPKTHSYASVGNGSIGSLYGYKLNEVAALDMVHVPYKGAGPVVQALLAGEVSASFVDYATLKAHIPGGKVRALAVSAPVRSVWTPDIPTFTEQGFPGFEAFSWVGVFVPAKTPPDVVQKLTAEITRALKHQDIATKLSDLALDPGAMPREQFAAMVNADHARWGAVIKASGMKLE
jgi:tripartite-type tricarboxylate transporter receptor subunit TctC